MLAVEEKRQPHLSGIVGKIRPTGMLPLRFDSPRLKEGRSTREILRRGNAHLFNGFKDGEQGMPKKNERRSQGEGGIA